VHAKVTEHIEIVYEQFHEHPKVFTKCHDHCMLVGEWNIFQSKGQNYPTKQSLIGNEGSLVHVFQGDHDMMITRKAI
jgi:hypothetical protein